VVIDGVYFYSNLFKVEGFTGRAEFPLAPLPPAEATLSDWMILSFSSRP